MLWGNETVSAPAVPRQNQVSKIRKTVVQAHDTSFLRIGTTTPGNQSFVIRAPMALATLRKQLAERQGDSHSYGVARKHRCRSRPRHKPTRYWGQTCQFLVDGGSWRFGVGCGRTDSYTIIIFLGVTPLCPYVVDHQSFLACVNDARRCYFPPVSPTFLRGLCRFSFQHAHISRCSSSLCLRTFVSPIADGHFQTNGNCDSLRVHHHLHER